MNTKNVNLFNHLLIEELKRKDLEIESLKKQISNEQTTRGRARCKAMNEIIALRKSLSLKDKDYQRLLNETLNIKNN